MSFYRQFPNRIMFPSRSWKAYDTVHIDNLPLQIRKFYIMTHTSWPLVFYITCWQFRHLAIHVFLPMYFSQIAVHLDESNTWSYELPLGSSLGFHPPQVNTIYLGTSAHHLPLVQKTIHFSYGHLPSSQAKWGLYLASL